MLIKNKKHKQSLHGEVLTSMHAGQQKTDLMVKNKWHTAEQLSISRGNRGSHFSHSTCSLGIPRSLAIFLSPSLALRTVISVSQSMCP